MQDCIADITALLPRLDMLELAEVRALTRAYAAYRDPSHPERECDHCGKLYRGPAAYCSHKCTLMDAL